MLDLIHPSSNDILLAIYRGGPKDEKEWAAVRRSAVTLAESGKHADDARPRAGSRDWMKDAKLLVDVGNSAYKPRKPRMQRARRLAGHRRFLHDLSNNTGRRISERRRSK